MDLPYRPGSLEGSSDFNTNITNVTVPFTEAAASGIYRSSGQLCLHASCTDLHEGSIQQHEPICSDRSRPGGVRVGYRGAGCWNLTPVAVKPLSNPDLAAPLRDTRISHLAASSGGCLLCMADRPIHSLVWQYRDPATRMPGLTERIYICICSRARICVSYFPPFIRPKFVYLFQIQIPQSTEAAH